jgi:hypothetical protein
MEKGKSLQFIRGVSGGGDSSCDVEKEQFGKDVKSEGEHFAAG